MSELQNFEQLFSISPQHDYYYDCALAYQMVKTKTNVMLKTWKILLIIKGSIIIIIIIIIIAVHFGYYSSLRSYTIEARVYNVCKCLSIN